MCEAYDYLINTFFLKKNNNKHMLWFVIRSAYRELNNYEKNNDFYILPRIKQL